MRRVLTMVVPALLLLGAACADDAAPSAAPSEAGAELLDAGAVRESGTDVRVSDGAPGALRDAAPADEGMSQTEPPFQIPVCGQTSDPTCCPSALGFEDGSTGHFLTPACCRLALSNPQPVTTPTACGRGALRLDADFRAITPTSNCDDPDGGEDIACSYRTGEISRAVLTSLDLTGLTMSAAVYLEGPHLPAGPVQAQLFVLGQGGLILGPWQPIQMTGVWTAVELPIPDDGKSPGANIRILGVHIGFDGQAWAGRAYVDEISWH